MSEEDIKIDDYKLLNVIATGSVSTVWEAQDVTSNEHYAMKLLLPEAMKNAADKAALRQEAFTCKKFDHPNIIRMHVHKQTKNHAYYIMDYFNAPNVKSLLRNNARTVQVRIRRLIECVALGLGHIHEKGIVHRDIKPDNVLMSKSNEIRMIDFSLASPAPNALMGMLGLKTKTIAGTRTYLSPEVIKKYPATFQSDIYSFGVMIYECLLGRPPFMGGTPNDLLIKHIRDKPTKPSDLDPNVASDMDDFVLRVLAKNPKDRPKDMAQFLSEFRSLKIFKEEPELVHKQLAQKAEDKEKHSASKFLTSREDAERREKSKEQKSDASISKIEIKVEEVAPEKTAAAPKPQSAAPAPKSPAATQPPKAPPKAPPTQPPGQPLQMPAYPPGMMPQQYPPHMYPQGMGMQYPPPQMPMGQYPQANYYPQQPGNQQSPGQQMPLPQNPGYMPAPPVKPGNPGTGQQVTSTPIAPVKPPAPQLKKPSPPKPPVKNSSDDDLPMMDELPDIS